MLKPTKQAYLKHDLYKIKYPEDIRSSAYTYTDAVDQIKKVIPVKMASKGAKFVWCDTDRKDGAHGWFADNGTGTFRSGNHGFGKMSPSWGVRNLTEPVPFVKYKTSSPNDEEE